MIVFIYLSIYNISFLVFFRLAGTCSHVVGLVHTIAHYQNLNLKEVPAELSATSLPQQWHKPRGRKIKPQAVVSMTLANPIKSPADRKRKPIFTEVSSFWVSCTGIFGITTVESELLGTSVASVVSIFFFFGLLLASNTSPPVAGHGSGY